jgi:hypothetical protein
LEELDVTSSPERSRFSDSSGCGAWVGRGRIKTSLFEQGGLGGVSEFLPVVTSLELVPTLMIDDAETKMRTEASVLFELKTSVPFCHALQICELIYVDIYLARIRQVLR